jgi:hypothetical protein
MGAERQVEDLPRIGVAKPWEALTHQLNPKKRHRGFMDKNNPAGGDLPLSFYDEQQFKVEVPDQVLKTAQDLAEYNLEVAERKFDVILTAAMEYMFETSKENAMKSPELAREMDDLIRKIFHDQPEAMAEWEAFIKTCEIADEEIEDL